MPSRIVGRSAGPVTGHVVEVRCAGTRHRIELVHISGAPDLLLLDHDEDAERVLCALGAPIDPCLRVAELWRSPALPDVSACLLLDDEGAAAVASGKAASAAGAERRPGLVTRAAAEQIRATATLTSLPRAFRLACAARALQARAAAWAAGEESGVWRWHLEHELGPFLARRLEAEGRHLPPGGRPVRVSIRRAGTRPALVPGRSSWEAHIPVDAVAWIAGTTEPLSPWFEEGLSAPSPTR